MLSMIIWIYLSLSKCGYIFIKDVSTFLSLYRNVSTFLGWAIHCFFQNVDAFQGCFHIFVII